MENEPIPESYIFALNEGEIIKINGIPYRYNGNGLCEGGTDPEFARNIPNTAELTAGAQER